MTIRPRPPRAFALVVVLVIGMAVAVMAIGLTMISGEAQLAAVRTSGGELATTLAQSGLERAEAYAQAVIAGRGHIDFDRVLDPERQADCSQIDAVTDSGVVPESGSLFMPMWTDGAIVSSTKLGQLVRGTAQPKRFYRVALNGGAYLVRFEDNYDDGAAALGGANEPDWQAGTNNNKGPGNNCFEGPAAPPSGSGGVSNPARDRDKAIWVTVVGIARGIDPDVTQHRVVLRKLIVDARSPTPAAVQVGDTLTVDGGGQVQMCSDEAGMTAGNAVSGGPPGSCSCGTNQATSVTGFIDCGACCGSNEFVDVDAPAPAANVDFPEKRKWYEWQSSCSFLFRADTASNRNGAPPALLPYPSGGLWFWDAQGTRAGVRCGDYNGDNPTPDMDIGRVGSCWVPLILGTSAQIPSEVTVAAGRPQWHPRNNVVPVTLTLPNGTPLNAIKPDWSLCPDDQPTTTFKWSDPSPPGPGSEDVSCTGCSPGNTMAAMEFDSALGVDRSWRLLPAPTVYPRGVYYTPNDFAHAQNWGSSPSTQSPAAPWPMITLAVGGSFKVVSGASGWIGVGTRKEAYPSLIVANDVTIASGAKFDTAGTIYTKNTLTVDDGGGPAFGLTSYGMLIVGNDISVKSGGKLAVTYNVNLSVVSDAITAPVIEIPASF